ncbi:transcriptional adapter 1 isoform X2 [Octopus sinensis]|uniref:Transcriptional adapter 1 isoform X2 n=1 Tax=Octopus sinensis TaxID=2607531 RepID=A0A6P7U4P7_9MOLL|nr:transcriptional adapter 1 isoform X2 [Octopus sinensis]
MAVPINLNAIKKDLTEALGDSINAYQQSLKAWFRQKMSKEEFDTEARKMLKADMVHLHNRFLLSILAKCQVLSNTPAPAEKSPSASNSSPKQKPKLKRKATTATTNRNNYTQKFIPVNPISYAPVVSPRSLEDDINVGFSSREATLPDISMVHGRMYVCAWENGLDDVAENAVKFVMTAVESQLKDIIVKVLGRKSGYKLREKRFKYSIGCDVPNPYLRRSQLKTNYFRESDATEISNSGIQTPTIRLSEEAAELEAIQQLASVSVNEQMQNDKGPITLFHLLDALQLYRNVIPSHSVYVPAVEKTIHQLSHSTHEELEQDVIHHQEVNIKQQLANQQYQLQLVL